MARPSKRRYWLTLKCSRSRMEKAGSHAVRGKPAQSARRDFGRLWAAERAGDGRDLGLGRLELGFVSAGVPAIGRNAGGGKKEQS